MHPGSAGETAMPSAESATFPETRALSTHWAVSHLRLDNIGESFYSMKWKYVISQVTDKYLKCSLKKVKVSLAQTCPALWDPMDCSLPGSSVHGISQARILEWVAIPSSRGSSWTWTWVFWTFWIELGSSAAGGFFTAEPLGKSVEWCIYDIYLIKCSISVFTVM